MASVYHSSAKHIHQVSQIQAAFFLPTDIFSNRKTTIKKHSKQTKEKKHDKSVQILDPSEGKVPEIFCKKVQDGADISANCVRQLAQQ